MSYHFTRKNEDLKGAAEFRLFKSKYAPDDNGYYGKFGGAYIPEMLYRNVKNCELNTWTLFMKKVSRRSFTDC
jgi:hypothetical protein